MHAYSVKRIKNEILKGGVKKYSINTFWMAFEKIISLTINLFVGVWLARYLGPSDFGILNLAIAIAAIFLPVVDFGLQGILVKELFNNPQNKNKILGTSFALKFLIAILAFILIYFAGLFDLFSNEQEKNVIILVAISILFQPFSVINSWYESQINVKLASILKTLFFCCGSIIKVIFILRQESLINFAILYSIEASFIAIAVVVSYIMNEGTLFNWRFDMSVLKDLTSKSWLLVFSSISAVIYLKIDQVMLGYLTSEKELGLYSAAVKLSEAWYFIPWIIANALFPAILNAKNQGINQYTLRLQQLCDFLFIISLLLALIVTILSDTVVTFLYGEVYNTSSIILKIHIWGAIFIFLRSVLSKWLIAEDKYIFSLISQLSGALMNVVLNFILIPIYGGMGAAIATVISYSITSFFVLGLFKGTKPIFSIFSKSLIFPIRLLSNYEKVFKKN